MIIRELITKLSFNVDQKGIENFNRAIIGIKAKYALVSGAITGLAVGFVHSLQKISDSILDTKQLSQETGVATKRLIELQNAARQFRISPEQFSSSFQRLNQLILDAEFGFGQLHDLARQLKIEIRNDNKELLSTEELFFKIIDALSKIKKETIRFDIAKRIFGEGKFANAAKEGEKALKELAKSFEPVSTNFDILEEKALKFDQSLSRLSSHFNEFTYNVLPPVIDFTAKFFEEINDEIKSAKKGTFLEDLFKKIGQEAASFDRSLGLKNAFGQQLSSTINNQKRIEINTRIEVQTPAGTEAQQKEFFESAAKEAFTENFNGEMEKILNNFPETE